MLCCQKNVSHKMLSFGTRNKCKSDRVKSGLQDYFDDATIEAAKAGIS